LKIKSQKILKMYIKLKKNITIILTVLIVLMLNLFADLYLNQGDLYSAEYLKYFLYIFFLFDVRKEERKEVRKLE